MTVIGQAGVGKSRLLRELTERGLGAPGLAADAASASCPPTARGSPTGRWARSSASSSRSSTPTTPRPPGRSSASGSRSCSRRAGRERRAAERVAATIAARWRRRPGRAVVEGVISEDEDPQQTRARLFSAVRSLVEAASRHPLVLAIEDIHWADEGMLDLIEYLARWVRGPVLLVCLARDELLERRSGWGGGGATRRRSRSSRWPARSPRAGRGAAARPTRRTRDARVVAQVAERSGGNPLFAEEMVNRLLEEGGGAGEALPETVHAVLAARLDALTPTERTLIQHASVIGQTFWQGAVGAERARRRRDARLAGREGPDRLQPRQPADRRARVRLQARPDPRRRLRDAAEDSACAQARRGRRASSRSAPPTAPRR